MRKIIRHPRQASWIISSVQGNNEVSVWDMETTNQHLSLWASNTPPLSKANVSIYDLLAKAVFIWSSSCVFLIFTSSGWPAQYLCYVHVLRRTFKYATVRWNGPTNPSVVSETVRWRMPSHHAVGQWCFNENILFVRVSYNYYALVTSRYSSHE